MRKISGYSGIKMVFIILWSINIVACDSNSDIPVQYVDSQGELIGHQEKNTSEQVNIIAKKIFYFGFDLRSSPQEDAAQYLPFLAYLEQATGYQFKLHFTPKGSSSVDELGQNKTQFSALGATSFLDANARFNAISLVRGLNQQNKAEYQSVFVVRTNSGIRQVKDFKGHKLAFGSTNSTQGHLIPRIMLIEQDVALTDLSGYHYTGSHQNCAEAVVSGNYDICGMQDQLASKLVDQGLLKIIQKSKNYPSSGIVVNQSVPVDIQEKVKQALIAFDPQGKHNKGLYHWDRTEMTNGFVSAEMSDYDDLKKWAIELGFLKVKSNSVNVGLE